MPRRAAADVDGSRDAADPGVRAHRGRAERAAPAGGRGRAPSGRRRPPVPARVGAASSIPTTGLRARGRGDRRAVGARTERLRRLPRRRRAPRREAMRGEWLRTGDLVHRDADGVFRIVDRLKDIFISGGENVAPAEVEYALTLHPLDRGGRRRGRSRPGVGRARRRVRRARCRARRCRRTRCSRTRAATSPPSRCPCASSSSTRCRARRSRSSRVRACATGAQTSMEGVGHELLR